MTDTVRSLSTSGMALKQQIQCWTDALATLCGQFEIDPLEASSFEARIRYATIWRLKLCKIAASQHVHTAAKANAEAHPFVKIHFQTFGASQFEQGGHRFDLEPGDCLTYDVSRPHAIVSPMPTCHEVVIVPKNLLHKRGFSLPKMTACKFSARSGTGRIAYGFVHAAFDEATRLSPKCAIGVADTLIDLVLLSLRGPNSV